MIGIDEMYHKMRSTDEAGDIMQRLINDPDLVVNDMLKGFVKAHADLVTTTENERVISTRQHRCRARSAS